MLQVAENSVLFMAYGLCQKMVAAAAGTADVNSLTAFQNALSGSFAAFFSSLVLCPTELVKCKMQAMHEMSGGKPTTKHMYRLTRLNCNYKSAKVIHYSWSLNYCESSYLCSYVHKIFSNSK